MQDFGSLKLLVALLGSSWHLLGPIWSQNGPQNGPKSGPKSAQKLVQKMDPKITPKMPVLGPKMAPKLGSEILALPGGSLLGHPSGARWPHLLKEKPKRDYLYRGCTFYPALCCLRLCRLLWELSRGALGGISGKSWTCLGPA